MKKNVLMRAASGLLVATMLTTCAISGTFAKYVTQDNGGDMARVAKWGVVVQVEGDLYGQNYLDATNTESTATDSTVSVSSKTITDIGGNSTANLVAPGTESGSPFTFSIDGTPEVDSKATVDITTQNIYLEAGKYGVMVPVEAGVVNAQNFAEFTLYIKTADTQTYTLANAYDEITTLSLDNKFYTLEDVVENGAKYYPVEYTMDGATTFGSDDATADSAANKGTDTLAAVANTILAQIGATTDLTTAEQTAKNITRTTATSAVIDHNTDLEAALKLYQQEISWEWEFHDEGTEPDIHGEPHHISQQDKLDTILGNLMAERVGDNAGAKVSEVVKMSDDYLSGSTLIEYQDYCLDTMFDICITVEQVD